MHAFESKTVLLRYGNTNTFLIRGEKGSLLIDTDYAGTLSAFYKAIGENHIRVSEITWILATHYHPDHIGLVGELMRQGVRLLLLDSQVGSVHYSDGIFREDPTLRYIPVDETKASVISSEESRTFLQSLGISGEIIKTPSHSPDSISVILDKGDCIVGDLEPFGYLEAYEKNPELEKDWENILDHKIQRIFYAHIPVR